MTAAARSSEARPYEADLWRLVESQSQSATMRITDDLDEQRLLEDLIEEIKPPYPSECDGLHFLLKTPFRYAPYPKGSRFRRAQQRDGVFYGSEKVETAAAELAFYRLLFFIESPQTQLPRRPAEHTAFSAPVRVQRLLDLTLPPFDRDQTLWQDPSRYDACQDLADQARHTDIQALRYRSVRDRRLNSCNVALLTPSGFASQSYRQQQTWQIFVRRHSVQVWREFPPLALEFPIEEFANDPRVRMSSRHHVSV